MTDIRDEVLLRIDAIVTLWEHVKVRDHGAVVAATFREAADQIRIVLEEVGDGIGSSTGRDDDDD